MKSLCAAISRRPLLFLTAACLLVYLPFLNKAFNIDSNVTVYVARQMTQNPLNPPLGEYGKLLARWNNYPAMPQTSVFYATPHPPLVPLYLMPFVAVFGEREWVLNLAMFPFYAASAIFFFGIAGRLLQRWRVETTLLFMLCPAVAVNAQNVMLDVPLMAFILGAFYCMFRSEEPLWSFLAGVCAAAACLTKFTGGTVVVAGMAYYVIARQWRNGLLFLLPVAAANGWWALHTLFAVGKMQLFAAGGWKVLIGDVRYRFERELSLAGATVLMPLFPTALGLFIRELRRVTLMLLAGAAVWSFALMAHLGYSLQHAVIFTVSAASGGLLLYAAATRLPKATTGRIATVLLLHAGLQLTGGLLLGTMAARYLLPMLFVAVLAVAYLVDMAPVAPRLQRRIWAAMLLCTLPITAALAVSDYQYVNAERSFARDLRKSFPESRLYYAGRLGYLYYMHRAGAIYLGTAAAPLRTGDCAARNCFSGDDVPSFSLLQSLDSLKSFSYPLLPVRTMGKGSGFYGCDRIPYSIAPTPRCREFIAYRVGRRP